MTFKRFLFAVLIIINVIAFSVTSSAAIPDLSAWNECPMYSVLDDGGDSNSAVDCIVLRVDPELESNQLHMLILADLKSFEDESKAGIKIKFNNIGNVELYCNSEVKYDSDVFFAEIDNVFSDSASLMLGIEFTVGIKAGIPDHLIIDLNLYDTQGIASNTYTVDITDSYTEEVSEEETDDELNATEKAKKTRTTKYKTTKVKTTKVKTSKTKKTNAEDSDSIYEYNENETTLQQEVFEDVHMENDKNKLIIICAAAVVACTAGGCAVGIINSRKKKNSKGDDQ